VNKQPRYRRLLLISIIAAAVMAAATLSGCNAAEEQDQKQMSLSEYLSETNENWFLTGKKVHQNI